MSSSATAIAETYDDVRNLGKSIARSYCGLDISYQEALTHFDDAFLEAYFGGWNPGKGSSFSTWVRTKAYYKILDARSKDLQRLDRWASNPDLNWVVDHTSVEDESRNIYQDIETGDARRILEHLAANRDTYEDLSHSHAGIKEARKRIRAYLKKTYAWNPQRICAAMRHITNYLKGHTDVETT